MERPLVPMKGPSFRIQRKPVFFLQNVTASNSVSLSTRFTAGYLRRRYLTLGFPVRDRAPQAARTGHVNASTMVGQLGKAVPSARPAQRIHRRRRGHRKLGCLSDGQSSRLSHPATQTRYPTYPGSVHRNRTGTSAHNGTVHRDDKSHCFWKASATKCILSAQSTIRLGFPTRAGQFYKGRLNMVVPSVGVLKRSTYQNKTSQGSTGNRRFKNRMASGSQWKTGSGLLGPPGNANAFKLPRFPSHSSRLKTFRARLVQNGTYYKCCPITSQQSPT